MATASQLLKTEPASPVTNAGDISISPSSWVPDDSNVIDWTALEDDYDDDIDDEQFFIGDDCETKAHVAAELLENLEQLEDLDELIKEEPYVNWMEDKPLVSNYHQQQQQHPQDDGRLMKSVPLYLTEFENVFDVDLSNTLTPPQSPPYAAVPMLASLLPIGNVASYGKQYDETSNKVYAHENQQQQQFVPQLEDLSSASSTATADFKRIFMDNGNYHMPTSDVDRELAVVDEIVRARAENFIPTSPSSSSSISSSSSSFSDDADLSPDECKSPKMMKGKRSRSNKKPYGNEDRRSRKKEQNKNAATRYRLKKKAEVEEILTEERQLQKQNDNLEGNISDLQREIKYLKGLMRDLFKAKGLI